MGQKKYNIYSSVNYSDDDTREMNNILTLLTLPFESLLLSDISAVKLMNRIDSKFIGNNHQLSGLLSLLTKDYFILEVQNQKYQKYTSTYFDTEDFQMYLHHHNQRVNRYKIRHRIYHSTRDAFLEIKKKDNKSNTVKTRMQSTCDFRMNIEFNRFITNHTCYSGFMLYPVIQNSFHRITLINKKFSQRITIDTGLKYLREGKDLEIPDLMVIEVKTSRGDNDKKIFELLHKMKIYQKGMSKYCMGLAILKPTLKQNLLKSKLHYINKIRNHGRTYQ